MTAASGEASNPSSTAINSSIALAHRLLTGMGQPGAFFDKIASRDDYPCYASALDYIRRITAPRHVAREGAPRTMYRSMEAPDDVPAPALLRAVTSVEADPHAPTAPAAPDRETAFRIGVQGAPDCEEGVVQ